MKSALAAICAALLVGGCASTAEVLQEPATQTFHSSQSANEVAFCLANKNATSALQRDDGSRVILIKNGYGAVSMAFSVFPEGTGSRIDWRKKFGTVGGIWKQCVGIKSSK